LSQKNSRWVGAQGSLTSAKNAYTCSHYDAIDKKTNPKTTRISAFLEGLNNSLAQSAAGLWLNKTCPNWANVGT